MFSEKEIRQFVLERAEQWCDEHGAKPCTLQQDANSHWILLARENDRDFEAATSGNIYVDLGSPAVIEEMMAAHFAN